MSLSTSLAPQVPATIRDRGREYHRDGAVEVLNVSGREVAADVQGTETYEVDLALEGRTIYASCTCPYIADHGAVCKHIWATILAIDNRPFARNVYSPRIVVDEADGGDESDGSPFFFADAPRAPVPTKPKPDDWRKQLAALSAGAGPTPAAPARAARTNERRLLYVVDPVASEQAKKLVLEIGFQERKKNNEWGKPRAQYVSHAQAEDMADETDRQVLALLGGAERADSYSPYSYGYGGGYYSYGALRYRVAGPLLGAVLPLLAATGRVRYRPDSNLRTDLQDLEPDLVEPWHLTVGVARDSTGKKWELSGALRRGEETLDLRAPALLVPGLVFHGGRYARLADSAAFPWVPVLRRAGRISVPANKTDEFLAELLKIPGLPKLDLPDEMRYTEEAVPPRPKLVVRAPKGSAYSSRLEAELSFDYAGTAVTFGAPGRGSFDPGTKRFVPRDPVAERAAADRLARAGARPAYIAGKQALEVKPSALPKMVRELTSEGWHVEAEGKLYRHASDFKLNVSSGSDWFDLKATADFGGTTVALPRLLAALKKGETSIALDDGSVGMVPEEWLKKYGLIARMGTVEGDSVRFGKSQVGVLDALLAARPEVTFDEQFAKARDELNKFEGVAAADPPDGFVGTLRGYQREGLGWLRFLRDFDFGGCLADDMGLGKTIQVLSLLAGPRTGPALVVVPKSLIFNWKQEAAKFAPALKVLDHTGTARDKTGAAFKEHDLVLTTYGTLRNDAELFAATRFDTCVLDESQAAKNASTETAKAVRLVNAEHRVAMSGTPVENHLGELFTLFDFLNPGMLGRGGLALAAGVGRNPDPEAREILGKALRPFILRRTKDQVAKDLPAKTEKTVYCDLEGEQQKLYDELRDHYRQLLLTRVDTLGMGKSKIQVLEALLRLRQAACHPGLIDKKRGTESSAKLDVLLPQLAEVTAEGHKALVFSQFTELLGIVRKKLDAEKIPYEYLDGKTRDRAARVEKFQNDPNSKLFLISLKAGGVGLNLTAAEYVFLLDPWWNPAVEAQAIDRSHRIGQTKPVFAYRLIARGTVEEKVLALQESKRALADAILGGDGSLITDLKREDLELLLS
ncbi:MAG: helicase SNF2 [Planctomycetes bacterium]|nr:helicase SNF2 [Planctomycetota bacterium]